MADSTISQLPVALSVSASDVIPIDQGGVTKRTTLGSLGTGIVFAAPGKYLTINNTLTFQGTDGTTITFPATDAVVARTDAGQTFTGTQVFGVITCTTINGGTLSFVAAKTLTVNNTITFTGTDGVTITLPATSATMARTDSAQTFTGVQTFSSTIVGNIDTADALNTARTIDGVSFDGTADILVIAPATNAATSKTTPVGADAFPIRDSVSGLLNQVTFTNALNFFAALAGNSSQVFSAAAATVAANVVRLDQVPQYPFRNRFVNGDFTVSQINGSSAVTVTAAAALQYVIDQWYAYCTGANVSGQRIAGTGSTQYRYQFTGAASVTAIGFAQRIEQSACYDMNGQSAIIGVDMSNSLLTSVTYTVNYANTADTFGTLASPTVTQIATGTITVSSTLTRYYIPVSIPSAATTGIEIVFSVGAQTSGTWVIGSAQFEVVASGAIVGTSFEVLPYEAQLRRCQRYLPTVISASVGTIGTSFASTTTNSYVFIKFTVPTRVPVTGISIDTVANLAIFDTGGRTLSAYAFNAAILDTVGGVFSCTNASTTAGLPGFVYCLGAVKIYWTGAQL
jgi:hypothetical protein